MQMHSRWIGVATIVAATLFGVGISHTQSLQTKPTR